jgi:DNA-binding response OmpR family regulator
MQQYLENENFCVVTSATVYGAFRQIVTRDFDVVITDLHTRRTRDGLRLVTAIRHLQPEALIVAVSDSLDVQQAVKTLMTPASMGWWKECRPMGRKELMNKIRADLRERAQPPRNKSTTNWRSNSMALDFSELNGFAQATWDADPLS